MKNVREEITNSLVDAIKTGTAPWTRPWRGGEAPKNISGREYSGINTLILTVKGLELDGGLDPRWMTYCQANERGMKIKKGAKGTHVTLWKPITEANEQEEKIVAVVQRFFTVFHASQVEGITEYTPPTVNEIEAHETAEKIISASGAEIVYGGARAYYQPSTDSIHMPPKEDFISATGYYSTLLHELTHWTGHSTRLNRNISGGRYSQTYAREELVAEIGSMFISCAAKIPQSDDVFQNHASYVDSWLECIKNDQNAIFKAAADANRAADYILKGVKQC
jgi:antirestriction protein ArdC